MDKQICFLAILFPTHVIACKARNFESIEHFFISNGLTNESFTLQPFPSKFQDFEIFV
jgi:hypothetical protein